MPRRTRAVLVSLSSCAMAAFPVLKPGRRSHHMISGLAQCSFALWPARSLTPSKEPFPSRAPGVSLPPRPPRLLPAGAKFAGWVFFLTLPLESCAFLTAHFNSLLGAVALAVNAEAVPKDKDKDEPPVIVLPKDKGKDKGPVYSVPDTASTVLLLGTAILVLGIASRRFAIR
jgi:hypothetical protein